MANDDAALGRGLVMILRCGGGKGAVHTPCLALLLKSALELRLLL